MVIRMKKKKFLAPIILLISILLMFCSGCGDNRYSTEMTVYTGLNVRICWFNEDNKERTERFTYDGKEHVFSKITLRDSSNRDITCGEQYPSDRDKPYIVIISGTYDDGSGTWEPVYSFKEVGTYVFEFKIQEDHPWAIPFTAKSTLIVEPNE